MDADGKSAIQAFRAERSKSSQWELFEARVPGLQPKGATRTGLIVPAHGRPSFVVVGKPLIEVGQQLFEVAVDLAPRLNAPELVERGPVEALDHAVGLRALGPCARAVG